MRGPFVAVRQRGVPECSWFYTFSSLDDKAPVTDTNIPSHLEQMLEILTQEERERESGETGPCMEYLLHHKILETLYTLGKADVRTSFIFFIVILIQKMILIWIQASGISWH